MVRWDSNPQFTSWLTVCSTACFSERQRKHQSFTILALYGIQLYRWITRITQCAQCQCAGVAQCRCSCPVGTRGSNRPISQIPQCTCSIWHNATSRTKNVHIFVLIGALWNMGQVLCVICEFDLRDIDSFGPFSTISQSLWLLKPKNKCVNIYVASGVAYIE